MPGRNFVGANGYRYGFGGKEKDNELKGNGNSIDYGARIYDPRIGRWLSTDPLENKFTALSPYNFAANNPIYNIDDGGMGGVGYIGEDGKLYVQFTYVAVTEGELTYTDVEIKQIENVLNDFWKTAKGMNVTLADGTQVEIGGVQVNVIAGGSEIEASSTVKQNFQNNLLSKQPPDIIEEQVEAENGIFSENVSAITFKGQGSDTYNNTYISTDILNGSIQKRLEYKETDYSKVLNNTYKDESGHLMGTSHPKDGDNLENFGSLEKGITDENNNLQLSPKDVQNIVKSADFKVIDKPKAAEPKKNEE